MKAHRSRCELKLSRSTALDYLLYLPEHGPSDALPLPLVVFLHGSGERGSDLSRVCLHGPPKLAEQGRRFPFILLAPQCPEGRWWDIDAVQALVDQIRTEYPVDPARITLTGLSMGGWGTWALANAHPDTYAAIAPICSPFVWDIEPGRFVRMPVWYFHGAMDTAVPLEEGIRMVRQLRDAGASVRFTVYPDAGHDSWTEPYSGDALYDWLLQQRRA